MSSFCTLRRARAGLSRFPKSSVFFINTALSTSTTTATTPVDTTNSTPGIAKRHKFSKAFHELCYQHLFVGQHKQQALWHWLQTTQKISNWEIDTHAKQKQALFRLHPSSSSTNNPTAISVPLQLIGTYSQNTNSFLFAYNNISANNNGNNNEIANANETISLIKELPNLFPDISEFDLNFIFENFESPDIGYMLSSILISVLNINGGYYACPYSTTNKNKLDNNLFVVLDKLSEYGYDEKEWLSFKSMDLFNIFGNTVYRLGQECHIELKHHLHMFENLFKCYGILYNVECVSIVDTLADEQGNTTDSEIQVRRLVVLESEFEMDNGYYEFDMNGTFRNIGMIADK